MKVVVLQLISYVRSWTVSAAAWAGPRARRRWAARASGPAAAACCASPRASLSSASRRRTISCRTTSARFPKRTIIFSNGRSVAPLSRRQTPARFARNTTHSPTFPSAFHVIWHSSNIRSELIFENLTLRMWLNFKWKTFSSANFKCPLNNIAIINL